MGVEWTKHMFWLIFIGVLTVHLRKCEIVEIFSKDSGNVKSNNYFENFSGRKKHFDPSQIISPVSCFFLHVLTSSRR